MKFRQDFVWGAASSAYQIEGAWNEGGKCPSVWDIYAHQKGHIYGGHTGDTACDSYHLFEEDVALMKEMGLKAYRFSVSWCRIFPQEDGGINEEGMNYYSRLADCLLEAGIEPYVTLFHWDMPYWVYKKGGWLNDDIPELFAKYAGAVVERLSDRVKYFITFNEPQCFIGLGFLKGEHAPGLICSYRDVFEMCHNMLKSHGRAVIEMRARAKQPIKIGYAPTGTMTVPATDKPEDIEAARKKLFECPPLENWTWNVSWWSDPVVLGCYPADGLEKYREYLPKIMAEDMELISEPIDFYAQNIYQGKFVKADEKGEPVVLDYPVGMDRTAAGWAVNPPCLKWGPLFLYERYKLPFYITENGMSAHDVVSEDGRVHDPNRINYTKRHLEQLSLAAEAGADIRGYFHWSVMDNFEWAKGYSERFGLIYVDFNTKKRIIKDSGYWYKELIEAHAKA